MYVLTRFLVTNAYFISWMLTFDMLFIIFRNLDNHAKVYKYRLYLLYLSLLSLLSSPCAARRACALRALGLLLADGAPTVGWGTGPSVLRNFNPGIFGTGFLQNPGIPGFSGTGLTYFFHPGIDGIPGFFGTGFSNIFDPGI